MSTLRLTIVAVAVLALAATPADAQKRCTKGIPCGNTCIAANKTCRVGSGTATSAPATRREAARASESATGGEGAQVVKPSPMSPVAALQNPATGPYVADRMGKVFYATRSLCLDDIEPQDRRYFTTESAAIEAGYRRSKVPGC